MTFKKKTELINTGPKLIGSKAILLGSNTIFLKKLELIVKKNLELEILDPYDFNDVPDILYVVGSINGYFQNHNLEAFPYKKIDEIVKLMQLKKRGNLVLITSNMGKSVSSSSLKDISSEQAKEIHWWKNIAVKSANYGLSTNILSLGFTTLLDEAANSTFINELLLHQPIRRKVTQKEIVEALRFLSSTDCSYMIGQVLSLDGGMSLKNIPRSISKRLTKEGTIETPVDKDGLTYDLTGKNTLIIGSSSGIGKETACLMSQRGSRVALLSRNNEKNKVLANYINSKGGFAKHYKTDVLNRDNLLKSIESSWEDLGSIDILIYASGHISLMHKDEKGKEGWNNTFGVNFYGYVISCEWLIKQWVKNNIQGTIVGVGSVNATAVPTLYVESYGASKAAMIQYSRCLSTTWAKYGIRANCVSPGIIKTPMTTWLDDSYRQCWLDHIPLNRIGEPKDVAGTIAYLASPISSYVSGEQLIVDGGYTLGYVPSVNKLN